MKITISEETKSILKALAHSIILPVSLSFISGWLGLFWLFFSGFIYGFIKKDSESRAWYFFFIKSAVALMLGYAVFYIFVVLAFSL